MSIIYDLLYSKNAKYAQELKDQIESLEVMANLMGYEIEVDYYDRDEYIRVFFYRNERFIFSMIFGATVKFNLNNKTAHDKMEHLKQQGKVRIIIGLRDGLVIAQSLL